MKTTKLSWTLIVAGLSLIATALFIVGYNVSENASVVSETHAVYQELEEKVTSVDTVILPEDTPPDYVLAPGMEMPVLEMDGHLYVGYISIPVLELELPVLNEWSYPNLKIASCRMAGSIYTNDLVLCAHNYTSHFGRLKDLVAGDEVIFTDIDGNVFSYTVDTLEQLEPNQVSDMITSDWHLTLFTCTLGGQYRVTVRCNRVEFER